MNPSNASRTALATSLMRALHTHSDPAPLLNDPWGDRLVPEAVRAALCERVLAGMDPVKRAEAATMPDQVLDAALRGNAAYADVILRARYTEDALESAVKRGVSQYVIVGAGFDSFICRRPDWAQTLAVYEIDHPATLDLKRRRLAECSILDSVYTELVDADLSIEDLGSALTRSSFDPDRTTFFSWLGVTMYLTRKANLATLKAIASCAPAGSELVFTYVDEAALVPGYQGDVSFQRLKEEVSAAGEAFLSGFDPSALEELLLEVGLLLMEDLSGHRAVGRYDAAATNGLRSADAAHFAHVRVVGS
ncbi:MAG: class I SAM-dependent methyltransferase [Burkholderiaceae bacterium]